MIKMKKMFFIATAVLFYVLINCGISYSNAYYPEVIGGTWSYGNMEQNNDGSFEVVENWNETLIPDDTRKAIDVFLGTSYGHYPVLDDTVYFSSAYYEPSPDATVVDSFQYDPLFVRLPASLEVGVFQNELISMSGTGIWASWEPFNIKSEIVGFENISVVAGQFNNSLKIMREFSDTDNNISSMTTEWFAENVGLVKRETTLYDISGMATNTGGVELLNYNLTPTPLPSSLFFLFTGLASILGIRQKFKTC